MMTTCGEDECGYRHCRVCGNHLDTAELGTCVYCLATVRRDLIAVYDLVRLLPDHALRASTTGGHLVAADPIPGGDAVVMLQRGSQGLSEDGGTNTGDPEPPAWVLGWWEDRWREALDLVPRLRPLQLSRADRTIGSAVSFLDWHLGWAARDHQGFTVFARDLGGLRRYLEALLHAGDAPVRGVQCFECGGTLEREYRSPRACSCPPRAQIEVWALDRWHELHAGHDQGGLTDPDPDCGWHCPRCRREYSPGEYRLAMQAAYDVAVDFRTQSDITRLTDCPRGTVQGWASRGQVRRRKDSSGRTVYSLSDVRERMAERLAGADRAEMEAEPDDAA